MVLLLGLLMGTGMSCVRVMHITSSCSWCPRVHSLLLSQAAAASLPLVQLGVGGSTTGALASYRLRETVSSPLTSHRQPAGRAQTLHFHLELSHMGIVIVWLLPHGQEG